MKIFALNCGSSSLKYQLFSWKEKRVVASGLVERIGIEGSVLHHDLPDGEDLKISQPINTHKEAIELVLNILEEGEHAVLESLSEISAVGHRIVHGGEFFSRSILIDESVIDSVRELSTLAPLHNPANVIGVIASMKALPDTPQIGIFDTAFHQTMPAKSFIYGLPYDWYEEYAIRRYGFHGSSHLYVSKRAASILGKDPSECNIISMHIGNGVSCCAIKNGESYDTSMGMTPLEGAIMGTRCGNIDPAIPMMMQKKLKLSPEDMDEILNKKSGLLGVTGKYTDRRDIIAAAKEGDERCQLAVDLETYYLKKYLGSYAAALGRVDAIVFTAGVGENAGEIRARILEDLDCLGIKIDDEKNLATKCSSGETEISLPDSRIKVFMIPTNEELVFVEDVIGILDGTYTDHMNYKYTFLD